MKLKYLFVQCQPSQLDSKFYGELNRLLPEQLLVVLFNNSGNYRKDVDPELGFAPVFPDLDEGYPSKWIIYGKAGLIGLMRFILQSKPECVVLQDQLWRDKIIIAIFCKMVNICVAFRSDKNVLSERVRSGFRLWIERLLVKQLFNIFCPVSELTISYYGWQDKSSILPFPYCTDRKKFEPENNHHINQDIRLKYHIPAESFVFLSAAKFVDRENPLGVVDAFRRVVISHPSSWLLMVGDGTDFNAVQNYVVQHDITNIVFVGYVPYIELQQYFFACNAFLHFAKSEPWGISPQDALIAGLGLITSDRVGSGICHLNNELSRFVVPLNNIDATVERMSELIACGNSSELFQSAKANVLNGFTTESLATIWAYSSLAH